MAKAATKESVSAAMKPVDYRGAFKRLTGIDAKKAKQQAAAKEIGDIFSAAEGICGVDKRAAKIFMIMRKLDEGDLVTVFRDLNGLLDAAGLVTSAADLVDQAENNVVEMRMNKAPKKADPDAEDGTIEDEIQQLDDETDVIDEDDDFQEATPDELAAQKDRPNAETYTGDNSDLAGDE